MESKQVKEWLVGLKNNIQMIPDHIFVKDKYRHEKIDYSEILWMKAENSYVEIQTESKSYLLTTDTLGSMLEKVKWDFMIRIHRSYAVNLLHVKALEGNQVIIRNQAIPIGKNYRSMVKEQFNFA